jgi:hypothetical protein
MDTQISLPMFSFSIADFLAIGRINNEIVFIGDSFSVNHDTCADSTGNYYDVEPERNVTSKHVMSVDVCNDVDECQTNTGDSTSDDKDTYSTLNSYEAHDIGYALFDSLGRFPAKGEKIAASIWWNLPPGKFYRRNAWTEYLGKIMQLDKDNYQVASIKLATEAVRSVLHIFESVMPDDNRPRAAIENSCNMESFANAAWKASNDASAKSSYNVIFDDVFNKALDTGHSHSEAIKLATHAYNIAYQSDSGEFDNAASIARAAFHAARLVAYFENKNNPTSPFSRLSSCEFSFGSVFTCIKPFFSVTKNLIKKESDEDVPATIIHLMTLLYSN